VRLLTTEALQKDYFIVWSLRRATKPSSGAYAKQAEVRTYDDTNLTASGLQQ
jgi:hypothetical protein